MYSSLQITVLAVCVILSTSCGQRPSPPVTHAAEGGGEPARLKREIRLTGIVEAVRSSKVLVPQILGPGGPMTLTKLIPNGVIVTQGDLIAVFDSTAQVDAARAALAKYEDLGHQVEQKRAQIRADSEKRIAELQRDRQKVALDRAESNMARLQLKAPLAGMVAHQTLYRNNSMGKAQEGDQLYRGQPLVSIFDPKEMLVRCAVGEPDGAALVQGTRATVYLDAYPDLQLPAHFEFASPVASSALGSPIKTFGAVFKLDKTDPHLMPDLSAAVVLETPSATEIASGGHP